MIRYDRKPWDFDKAQIIIPGFFGDGWDSEGEITDPATNTVLARTPPLLPGIYDFLVVGATSANQTGESFRVQHLSPGEGAVIHYQNAGLFQNQMNRLAIPKHKVNHREVVRIIAMKDITGIVQCSIFWTRLFPLDVGG